MAVEATNWEDAYWNLRKYVESIGVDVTAYCGAGGPVDPPADNTVVTGWPPGLLQDDSKALSKWLAGKPDAMRCLREAVTVNSTAGKVEPDNDAVICPQCTHQFPAIPVNVQNRLKELLTDLQEAAVTLRRYEALHRAKGTIESKSKAAFNALLAAQFEATIERNK